MRFCDVGNAVCEHLFVPCYQLLQSLLSIPVVACVTVVTTIIVITVDIHNAMYSDLKDRISICR